MTKGFYISVFFSLLSLSMPSQAANDSFESMPFWEENFNNNFVDTNIWKIYLGNAGNELEYYTNSKKNLYQRKGNLVIKAVLDKRDNTVCTSGRMQTKDNISFLYGKLSIRVKVPIGKGIFPAIWMLPNSFPKYPYGEIDIMEYIDCWKGKQIQSNVHIVTRQNSKDFRVQYAKKINVKVNKYHVYTLEWYKDKLVFLIDNVVVHQYDKSQNKDWPFNQPYHLIFNVAYGAWGGSCGTDERIFPKEMKIDWIRYYRLKE